LRRNPTVILACGSRNKAAVIAATLRAGRASILITDEDAAVAALALHKG
jgi:DNA-binding transcriptional regulator LsrR (DeoR family)